MVFLSRYFKQDSFNENVDIEPIVLVGDVDDNDFNIIDAYSFHSHSLHQESFGSIYTKPILNKISSVKNGVDYDRKTLKINRFRFSIHYNEFDPDKVTEVFMGKVVKLMYKSPRTHKTYRTITSTSTNKELMAQIFVGNINRVTTNGDIVSLQAEDFTQVSIKDKEVPTAKVEDYLLDIDGLELIKYGDKEKAIPMVFGSVDKAPAVNVTATTGGSFTHHMKQFLLHDSKPLYGTFYTSPIQAQSSTGGQGGISNLNGVFDGYNGQENPEYHFFKNNTPTYLYVKLTNGWGYFSGSGASGTQDFGVFDAITPSETIVPNLDNQSAYTKFSHTAAWNLAFPEYNWMDIGNRLDWYAVGIMRPSGFAMVIPQSTNANISDFEDGGGITSMAHLQWEDIQRFNWENEVTNGGYDFNWYRRNEDDYF